MPSLQLFITGLLMRKAGPFVPLLSPSLPQATLSSHIVPRRGQSKLLLEVGAAWVLGSSSSCPSLLPWRQWPAAALLGELTGAQASPLPGPGAQLSIWNIRCPQQAWPQRGEWFSRMGARGPGARSLPVPCVCVQALGEPVALASKGPWMSHAAAQKGIPGHGLLTTGPWSPCGPGLGIEGELIVSAAVHLQSLLLLMAFPAVWLLPATSDGGGPPSRFLAPEETLRN